MLLVEQLAAAVILMVGVDGASYRRILSCSSTLLFVFPYTLFLWIHRSVLL